MDETERRLLSVVSIVLGALVIITALCNLVSGQTTERIACLAKNGDVRYGTASCVCTDGKCYWLTCWHVVEDASAIVVRRNPVALLAYDKAADLAVLSGPLGEGDTAYKIGSTLSGGDVQLVGYGSDGERREWDATVLRNVDVEGMGLVSAPSRMGDSGGPVARNKTLCGVIHATDGKNLTVVIRAEAVRKLLLDAGFRAKCAGGKCYSNQ